MPDDVCGVCGDGQSPVAGSSRVCRLCYDTVLRRGRELMDERDKLAARVRELEERALRPKEVSVIDRLEKWNNGHKARQVGISIDDGYGATCWQVSLYGKDKKKVEAAEVSFFGCKSEQLPRHVVFVIPPEPPEGIEEKDWDWDWPGLEKTIHAALDRAEELGL